MKDYCRNTIQLDVNVWGQYLFTVRSIIAIYDNNGKSDFGLYRLLKQSAQLSSARIPRLKPGDKDITDYVPSGGNFPAWLEYQLEKLGFTPTALISGDEQHPMKTIQEKIDDWLNQPWKIDSTKPCYFCGDMNWQAYPDGSGHFCATCHPSPSHS